jgi:hypothetical protein
VRRTVAATVRLPGLVPRLARGRSVTPIFSRLWSSMSSVSAIDHLGHVSGGDGVSEQVLGQP